MEELIREKEYKIQQEKNQLKILKQKQSEENRKKRNKRLIEKGAVFESIFETTTTFTKDEFYELIAFATTLDDFKIKIMELEESKKDKEQNAENNSF